MIIDKRIKYIGTNAFGPLDAEMLCGQGYSSSEGGEYVLWKIKNKTKQNCSDFVGRGDDVKHVTRQKFLEVVGGIENVIYEPEIEAGEVWSLDVCGQKCFRYILSVDEDRIYFLFGDTYSQTSLTRERFLERCTKYAEKV